MLISVAHSTSVIRHGLTLHIPGVPPPFRRSKIRPVAEVPRCCRWISSPTARHKSTVERTGRDTAAASCWGGRRLRAEDLRGVPAPSELWAHRLEQAIAAVQDVRAVPARSHPAGHHG